MAQDKITIVAAARPHPHEVESGDLWTVQWSSAGDCRLAVIDGLGHGPAARHAAMAAAEVLAASPDLPPDRALALCHRPLAGTRGAAVSIARLDLAAGQITFAGIGNVEGRLWSPEGERRLIAQRGIVGVALPTLRPVELSLATHWRLLLYSDGISGRFTSDALPEWGGPTQPLADAILHRHGRPSDDATIVIAAPSR